ILAPHHRPAAPQARGSAPVRSPGRVRGAPPPKGTRGQPVQLSQPEKIVLQALVSTEEAVRIVDGTGGGLPPDRDLSDLFEYPPAREWVKAALAEAGDLDRLKFEPSMAADLSLDPMLRTVLIEAFMGEAKPFERGVFQAALERLLQRSWA